MNVRADAWGRGVGSSLLSEATQRLATGGKRSAVLWVLEANTRARRLYEARGWAPDGTTKILELAGAAIREVRYARCL